MAAMEPDKRVPLGLLLGGILAAAGIMTALSRRAPKPVSKPAQTPKKPSTSGSRTRQKRIGLATRQGKSRTRSRSGGMQSKSSPRRRKHVADPRAFISFDFDHDEKQRNLFAGQGKTGSPTPFTIGDWSSKEALAQSDWEAKIKDKIGRCNMVIVLVGRFMASATGVAKEIAMAKELDVPIFGVYVDGATSTSTLPTGLQRNRTITWTWPGIAAAINQMMTEGKNKK